MTRDVFVWLTIITSALMVPVVSAWMLDDRMFQGVNVWIKPLKFLASTAVLFGTIAWALTFVPDDTLASPKLIALAVALGCLAAFEIGYISLQAARAEGSHYNATTGFHRLMYGLMGIAAVAMLAISGIFGAVVLNNLPAPADTATRTLAIGAGVGLILGSVLGTVTGLALGSNPTGHWVGGAFPGGAPTDAGGLALLGWSRSGGDLRIAHFVGMHLMQAVPLAAWLATLALPAALHLPAIAAACLLGTATTWLVYVQASAGVPLVATE